MNITITINLDNDAFHENLETEVARILKEYARRLDDGLINMSLEQKMWRAPELLKDRNGNTIGRVEVSD